MKYAPFTAAIVAGFQRSGMRVIDFAVRANVSEGSASRILAGLQVPPIAKWEALERALEMDPGELAIACSPALTGRLTRIEEQLLELLGLPEKVAEQGLTIDGLLDRVEASAVRIRRLERGRGGQANPGGPVSS